MVATVVLGGMRSITFVQAFQYWLKLTALALPAIIAAIFFLSDERTFDRPAPPQFPDRTTVDIRTDVVLQVGAARHVHRHRRGRRRAGGRRARPLGRRHAHASRPRRSSSSRAAPRCRSWSGRRSSDASWLTPFPEGREHGLLATYSLIIALFLGTMGLPHVLVRFYTNPDGRAARRTAVFVLALLGGFYLAVTLLGALSRLYTPQLLVNGDTDAAVLLLPSAVLGSGLAGALLGGAGRGRRVGGVPVHLVRAGRERRGRAVHRHPRQQPGARLPAVPP